MSNFVFVLDTNYQPQNPIPPGQARRLLKQGKAAVYQRYPFTIILKYKISNPKVESHQLKIDPGSQVTGLAIVQDDRVIWGAELTHRGEQIKQALESRRAIRLKDAAAVNSTRDGLLNRLKSINLPLEMGTGGRTKYNRNRLGLSKTHWLDAACVGVVSDLKVLTSQPLLIVAQGWGSRQMCTTNKYGFPIKHKTRYQTFFGFKTGDMVQAILPTGKFAGTHVGRLTVRASGVFEMISSKGKISPVRHKYCKAIHCKDGYMYGFSTLVH